MKKLTIIFAFIATGYVAKAQNNETIPNPPGNGYGLYHHFSNISYSQIEDYLTKTGHTIIDIARTEDAGKTWTCTTILSDGKTYITVIYTDGENIVGYEDDAIG